MFFKYIGAIGNQKQSSKINSQEKYADIDLNNDYTLNYTEEEFMKEFRDDGEDDEQNFENDPR